MTDAKLAKGIDLWGVVALGLGTAVGVSIFSAIALAARIAGPAMLLSVLLAVLMLALLANLFGVHIATRVQKVLLVGMLILFAVFVVWGGATGVDTARLRPVFPHGGHGMIAATPLLMGLFFGIEAATEAGAEVADSRRTIPLGIALSIGSATLLYLAVGFVALGVLGGDALGASEAPILDAARRFMGPAATPLIVLAAVLSIGKSLNALFAMFSRSLYAMGQSGMLPSALGRVHPRWQTPHVALFAVFLLGCVGLLLPMELTFLFLAVNIPNLLKYGSICLAAARVVERHPTCTRRPRSSSAGGRCARWATPVRGAPPS